MFIKFEKISYPTKRTTSNNKYRVWQFREKERPDNLNLSLFRKDIVEDELFEKIKTILENKFEKIIIFNRLPMLFEFYNDADEVFFLVWSSEGLEL